MTEDEEQKPAASEVEGMAEDGTQDNGDEQGIERDLETYPLREPAEDPRWAVRIVWTWVGIALFLLLFLVTLMILGFWYD